MSPHQREVIQLASVVKSRRIRSARGVAAGSGMVVFDPSHLASPDPGANATVHRQDEMGAQQQVRMLPTSGADAISCGRGRRA
jgi:hypothetical protein